MVDLFRGLHARTADSILTADSVTTLPANGVEGDIRYVKDIDELYTYNGTTWSAATGGGVIGPTPGGPGSSTDNAIARWDGTGGTQIQNSVVLVSDSGAVTGAVSVAVTQDPLTSLQLTTKQYVDAFINGIKWKNSVRIATAAAGTLATSFANGQTVDGVVIATGDRILIKDQASTSEDGIYTVNASGAPTRAVDAATFGALNGATTMVQEGTANADKGFQQITELTSFSGQSWIQNFGTGLYTADNQGITLSGSTFSLVLDGTSLSKSGSGLKVNITGAPVGTTDTQTLTNKTLMAPIISTISNTGTLTLPTATDTLVGRATTDTLTNKTLTLPVISSISNGGTVTLPSGTRTLVARDTTDTLTNKTLTAPIISSIVNTGILTLPTSTDTLIGRNTTDTLTNKTLDNTNSATFKSGSFFLNDATDTSKQASFNLASITTATARTFTFPDASGTFALIAATQTLSNKTLGVTNTITAQDTLLSIVDDGDNSKIAKFDSSAIGAGTTRTFTFPNTTGTLALNPMSTTGDMIYGGTSGTSTNLATGATTGLLHGGNGAVPTWSLLVNADVSASAAIAGSKISPTFTTAAAFTNAATPGQAVFSGWEATAGVTSNAGAIQIGNVANFQMNLHYDSTGTTTAYLDNTNDDPATAIKLRVRTFGTPVTALTATGTGVTVGKLFTMTSASDASTTGTVNALTYTTSSVQLTASTTITLNGITAPAAEGTVLWITNNTGNAMSVVPASGSATTTNQISTYGTTTKSVPNGQVAMFIYCGGRWKCIISA